MRAIAGCSNLAEKVKDCLQRLMDWDLWRTTFGAIQLRSTNQKSCTRTNRCQWQAFCRVLQATRLGTKLLRSSELRAELVKVRAQFIDRFLIDGNIASTEFKTLEDISLGTSLNGTKNISDHILISRLGRAFETDPRVILTKDELSKSKAQSLYVEHPNNDFIVKVDDFISRPQVRTHMMRSGAKFWHVPGRLRIAISAIADFCR